MRFIKDIRTLSGIGEQRAKAFAQKGIKTVEDLLEYYPRDYEDRTLVKDIVCCIPGQSELIRASVLAPVKEVKIRKGMTLYRMSVADETGVMTITWYNNRFVKNIFHTGDIYLFFGKINPASKNKEMLTPIFEEEGKQKNTGRIVPVYPLWQNITQNLLSKLMTEALELRENEEEYIPNRIIEEFGLCDINFAINNIHFPNSFEDFEKARKRLVFEELLILQLALQYRKNNKEKILREPYSNTECVNAFLEKLPFSMTNAQKRALEEILEDFKKNTPMTRLVQGDVGSGKTAVAAASMYVTVQNGYQASIMAPTEILANQHFETFEKFFEGTGINICLLTGSTKKKKDVYEKIENGEYDIIIGTHAVIQEKVIYKNLGLVVTDEQHRFGVMQRAKLQNKGDGVHTLVMTATPIPRTLSFILYGDLDVSIIDELPPGRKTVETYAVGEDMRKRIYAFIDKNVKEGMQVYVVCPLIEETQKSDLENAMGIAEKMKKVFPNYNIDIIHGKMKPQEKEEIMERFSAGEINILVSTTVIEVGVNVVNANMMIIENAERFGLSQLHQLRGRVGRGDKQAYCILFAHGTSEVIKKRMETMCKTNDGFVISEEDLKLRGPGDFFGTRQHGLPSLKIANLFSDMKILKQAQKASEMIIRNDKDLSKPHNFQLKERIEKMFSEEIAMN